MSKAENTRICLTWLDKNDVSYKVNSKSSVTIKSKQGNILVYTRIFKWQFDLPNTPVYLDLSGLAAILGIKAYPLSTCAPSKGAKRRNGNKELTFSWLEENRIPYEVRPAFEKSLSQITITGKSTRIELYPGSFKWMLHGCNIWSIGLDALLEVINTLKAVKKKLPTEEFPVLQTDEAKRVMSKLADIQPFKFPMFASQETKDKEERIKAADDGTLPW